MNAYDTKCLSVVRAEPQKFYIPMANPSGKELDLNPVTPAELFAHAVRFASEVHLYQVRKVSGLSYLSHVLLAAGIAIQAGGSMRSATIAALHDVVEEGGAEALSELCKRFPDSIAQAVLTMTPNSQDNALSYEDRKAKSVARMREAAQADADVGMAYAAEKCATLWELEQDFAQLGPEQVMQRLRRNGNQIMWYYQQVQAALKQHVTAPMASTLAGHVYMLRLRMTAHAVA